MNTAYRNLVDKTIKILKNFTLTETLPNII